MERIEITRIDGDSREKVTDVVTEEVPVTIYVNEEEIVTLLSSPEDLEELAVGFLYTSGLLKTFDKISGMTVDTRNWIVNLTFKGGGVDPRLLFKRLFTSGCGRGTLFYKAGDLAHRKKCRSDMTVRKDHIFRVMSDFQIRSKGFRETGGVHSAALADNEKILVVREDIGRHNAVDKVLGYALAGGMELGDKIMFSSGRVSSEVLLKIQKTDIPVIVSRSAPTDQAIRHAEQADITLVGFVRGKRMNLYSAERRIL